AEPARRTATGATSCSSTARALLCSAAGSGVPSAASGRSRSPPAAGESSGPATGCVGSHTGAAMPDAASHRVRERYQPSAELVSRQATRRTACTSVVSPAGADAGDPGARISVLPPPAVPAHGGGYEATEAPTTLVSLHR